MPLQNSYRPTTLDEFFGNTASVQALEAQLKRDPSKRPFAYLITGPSGCGKTTLAYIIKNKFGCFAEDFIEIDASSDRGIQQMRNVREMLGYAPIGPVKVVFFDEVHGITAAAQEAILKMLESPPPNSVIILATTNPEKLKPTVKRRCHIINLSPLSTGEVKDLVKGVAEAEGLEDYPDEIVDKIESISFGSPGIALKILDSVIDLDDFDTIMKAVEQASYGEQAIFEICRILNDSRSAQEVRWSRISATLKEYTGDAEGARLMVLSYFEKVMLNALPSRLPYLSEIVSYFTDNFYDSGRCGLVMACYLAIYNVDVEDVAF